MLVEVTKIENTKNSNSTGTNSEELLTIQLFIHLVSPTTLGLSLRWHRDDIPSQPPSHRRQTRPS
jgi:hypothetical protein